MILGMSKIKEEFAKRLHYAADRMGIPPEGENRQAEFGKKLGVTQQAAQKWLNGISIPKQEHCIEIALKAKISLEWLMTGRGIANYGDDPISKVVSAMQSMDAQTQYQTVRLVNTLAEPSQEPNGKHNTQ